MYVARGAMEKLNRSSEPFLSKVDCYTLGVLPQRVQLEVNDD